MLIIPDLRLKELLTSTKVESHYNNGVFYILLISKILK